MVNWQLGMVTIGVKRVWIRKRMVNWSWGWRIIRDEHKTCFSGFRRIVESGELLVYFFPCFCRVWFVSFHMQSQFDFSSSSTDISIYRAGTTQVILIFGWGDFVAYMLNLLIIIWYWSIKTFFNFPINYFLGCPSLNIWHYNFLTSSCY